MLLSARPKAWLREIGWRISVYDVWILWVFLLRERRLLTASWTERNVSLDATARPALI